MRKRSKKKVVEKQKVEKPKQLQLGLKSPFKNILFKLKDKFKRTFIYFEIVSFTRTPLNWFFIVISLSLITIQCIYIYNSFGDLPALIPLFSYFTVLEKKLMATELILSLPILSLIVVFFSTRIAYKYFHKEKEMTNLLLLIMLCCVVAITVLSLKIMIPYYG